MKPRELALPGESKGKLWLSELPGRWERMRVFIRWWADHGITEVISLVDEEEIREKAPSYLSVLRQPPDGIRMTRFPIPDYEGPERVVAFRKLVAQTAERLLAGERLFLHCAAGIGRTGLTATCILMQLGCSREDSRKRVLQAGSRAETPEQQAFIAQFEAYLARKKRTQA